MKYCKYDRNFNNLEKHKDSIEAKDKVIIIDDLIATGGTAMAAAKLVERSGGKIESFVFVINLFDLGGKNLLEKKEIEQISKLGVPIMLDLKLQDIPHTIYRSILALKEIKFKYIVQIRTNPPTFKIFSNHPNKINSSYKRFLEKRLKLNYKIDNIPVFLKFLTTKNPYQEKKK
mgnify:CR=1 FL=1